MARHKRQPRVVPTPATTIEPVLDAQSVTAVLAAIGRGAEFYADDPPLFRAQDLMYDAFEAADPEQRVALARRALEISADCADAYLLLAEETASTLEEARELLEQGLAAGERALGREAFEEDAGYFWGILETRPYMRAREALAGVLWELGEQEAAVEHQRELLRLNPNDNQGIRYRQAEWLFELGRDDQLAELSATYIADVAADLAYTRALAAFRREGDTAEARRLLAHARNLNPHVPAYLTGQKRLPKQLPEFVQYGENSEAVDYASGAAPMWQSVPGALAWLASAETAKRPRRGRAAA